MQLHNPRLRSVDLSEEEPCQSELSSNSQPFSPDKIKQILHETAEIHLEMNSDGEECESKQERVSVLNQEDFIGDFVSFSSSSSSSCCEVLEDDLKGPSDLEKDSQLDMTEIPQRKSVRRHTEVDLSEISLPLRKSMRRQTMFHKRDVKKINHRFYRNKLSDSSLTLHLRRGTKILQVVAIPETKILPFSITGSIKVAELICRAVKRFPLEFRNFPLVALAILHNLPKAYRLYCCPELEDDIANSQNIESCRNLADEERVIARLKQLDEDQLQPVDIDCDCGSFQKVAILDLNPQLKQEFGFTLKDLQTLAFKRPDSIVLVVQCLRKFLVSKEDKKLLSNYTIIDQQNPHQVQRSRDLDVSEEKNRSEKTDFIMIERLSHQEKRTAFAKIFTVVEKQFTFELTYTQTVGDILAELRKHEMYANVNLQEYGFRQRFQSQNFTSNELDASLSIEALPVPWVQLFRRQDKKRASGLREDPVVDEEDMMELPNKLLEEKKQFQYFNYEEFKMVRVGPQSDDFVTVGLDYFDLTFRLERSVDKRRFLKAINNLFKKLIYYLIEDVEPIEQAYSKIGLHNIKQLCVYNEELEIKYSKNESKQKTLRLKVDDSEFQQADQAKVKEQCSQQMKKFKEKLDKLLKLRH